MCDCVCATEYWTSRGETQRIRRRGSCLGPSNRGDAPASTNTPLPPRSRSLQRQVARTDPSKKARFLRLVFSLLEAPSSSVAYEAASTLTSLSAAPSAVRAAAAAFIKILNRESDNNVKLIVLERLAHLRKRHTKTMRETVMDILRSLATPNNDIRRRTLDIAMDLVSPRNVEEVMALLRKEILATQGGASGASDPTGDESRYRAMLITAIHGCAVRFPDIAPSVVTLLMDFLGGDGALSVIEFVREIAETFPHMREGVLVKLRGVMPDITASDVFRVALWLLGQYSESSSEVTAALHAIRECIGPLPLITPYDAFVAQATAAAADAAAAAEMDGTAQAPSGRAAASSKRPTVLADGTYATQSAITAPESHKGGRGGANSDDDGVSLVPSLRRLLLCGDFFLASVVSSTLTKLALRVAEHSGRESRSAKAVMVDSMLVMCSIMELGASGLAGTSVLLPASALPSAAGAKGYRGAGGATGTGALTGSATGLDGAAAGGTVTPAPAAASSNSVRIDQDSFERVVLCMRVLGDPTATSVALPVLLHTCRDTFRSLLVERRARASAAARDGVATGGSAALTLGAAATAGGAAADAPTNPSSRAAIDDGLSIRLLRPTRGVGADDIALEDDAYAEDAAKAAALTGPGSADSSFAARLKRVHQLTGFADPIYAEAFVRVAVSGRDGLP